LLLGETFDFPQGQWIFLRGRIAEILRRPTVRRRHCASFIGNQNEMADPTPRWKPDFVMYIPAMVDQPGSNWALGSSHSRALQATEIHSESGDAGHIQDER
jgi:hypothetical protein